MKRVKATWFGAPFGRGFERVQRELARHGVDAEWREVDHGITGGVAPLVLIAPCGVTNQGGAGRVARDVRQSGRRAVIVAHDSMNVTIEALKTAGVLPVEGDEVDTKANAQIRAIKANATPSTSSAVVCALGIEKLTDVDEVEREVRAFIRTLRPAYRAYAIDEAERQRKSEAARVAASKALEAVAAVGDDGLLSLATQMSDDMKEKLRALLG